MGAFYRKKKTMGYFLPVSSFGKVNAMYLLYNQIMMMQVAISPTLMPASRSLLAW